MKTNADIIALQRLARDLQRERKRIDGVSPFTDYDRGLRNGFELSILKLRDHIKRLRARAAKGEGT